jgi:2Fe-2S ferredoxin
MVKIVIENLGRKEVVVNDLSKPVLDIFHSQGVDWMHACGGKGRCTTCKMIVLKGLDNLSTLTVVEQNYLRLGAIRKNERLACQVKVLGDIEIRVPPDGQLPHLHYHL